MSIEMRSRWVEICLIAIAVSLSGVYELQAVRLYRAHRAAAALTPDELQSGIRLAPDDAEYRDQLGRYYQFIDLDVRAAIPQYRSATMLCPFDSRYWLDLAGADHFAGAHEEEGQALETALKVDRTTPDVAWEAANFFLLRGEKERALHQLRAVVEHDPPAVDRALMLCWRATGDAQEIMRAVLPHKASLYLSFLDLLIAEKQVHAAADVWSSLVALRQPFSSALAFGYVSFLIQQRQTAAAKQAWLELATLDSALKPYISSDNLIVNGGFENEILNGGFDWLYSAKEHAIVSIDASEAHGGKRSLSVAFDANAVEDMGVYQYVPVGEGKQYEFSAALKLEDIVSASGPQLLLIDPYTNMIQGESEELLGSGPWRTTAVRFTTGPHTSLLLLKIGRKAAGTLIRGRLWVDDVRLSETK